MAYLPNETFLQLAKQIQETKKPVTITPRTLLAYFGAESRRVHVLWWVNKALDDNKLKTVPSYENEYFDAPIDLVSSDVSLSKKEKPLKNYENIILKIKILKAANKNVVSIPKEASLEKAMTLMMLNNFSQLPVMQKPDSRAEVKEMISWQSIGKAFASGINSRVVKDYTTEATTISYDESLLKAVEIIRSKEVVIVRKEDNMVSGLVTMTDLAEEFFSSSEPFFLIGEIEGILREIITDTFTLDELSEITKDKKEIGAVSELTFADYIALLRKGNNWERINLPIDKAIFTERLDEIREIRNDFMHFNAENMEVAEKNKLKQTADFMRETFVKKK